MYSNHIMHFSQEMKHKNSSLQNNESVKRDQALSKEHKCCRRKGTRQGHQHQHIFERVKEVRGKYN